MTRPQGLRRFVKPDPASTAPSPEPPLAPPTSAQSNSQAAAESLPPLLADLLQQGPVPQTTDEPRPEAERCELCKTEIPPDHGHVADLEASSLACACRACYLLFTQGNAGRGRYRAVPDRYLADLTRPFSPGQWERL